MYLGSACISVARVASKVWAKCLCPECTGPSETIPPEGLIELHPYGVVVCCNPDGSINFVMHPEAYADLVSGGETGGLVDVFKK